MKTDGWNSNFIPLLSWDDIYDGRPSRLQVFSRRIQNHCGLAPFTGAFRTLSAQDTNALADSA